MFSSGFSFISKKEEVPNEQPPEVPSESLPAVSSAFSFLSFTRASNDSSQIEEEKPTDEKSHFETSKSCSILQEDNLIGAATSSTHEIKLDKAASKVVSFAYHQ